MINDNFRDASGETTARSRRDAMHETIASEAYALLGTGRQTAPFSTRFPSLDLLDAYRVTAMVRRQREDAGERPLGRKIGFTNRTIWEEYGVYAPMWGYVYDRTVHELGDVGHGFPLAGLAEPRIEPEIVFGLASAPQPGMDARTLVDCLAWVAHGFELVQSLFPEWRFTAADTVTAFGLHGALLIGPRHPIKPGTDWAEHLASFDITLSCNGAEIDRGRATNVLDGPLHALRHLVETLDADPDNPPLAAGEIVTTGTLTRAFPVVPGETWSTALHGIPIEGISVRFV
jgi:2-oxo-3-hexenedioate decarboxylase